MASVVSVTSFAGSIRTVTIVGGVIGGFIVLVFLAISALQLYKMYRDSKQKSGAVWSLDGLHSDGKQQQQQQQQQGANAVSRITSGEFYMNYLEYSGDDSPIAPPSSIRAINDNDSLHTVESDKFRAVNVTTLSTEDGDAWRQHNQL